MSDSVIRVENVSKRFDINATANHDTLRGQLMNGVRSLLHRQPRSQPVEGEDFIWALRDVSFELKQGEVLGIVGKNGSGKSTLLKLLSRISPPTKGRIELYGRVASLLEVGTGFHPELTGRENVFMNAAIMGMTREEIRRKFDEIVAFAEVEKFIDTPIKRYSSGMYMRLAFSVAAHLEQEILIVDEVLAVGDATFQQKSMGKMDEVSHQGRTVLFVSHNMAALATLCPRSILLSNGRMLMDGRTSDVIKEYVKMNTEIMGEKRWDDPTTAPGNEDLRLHSVRVISGGEVTANVHIEQDIVLEFIFWNFHPDANITIGINLVDKTDSPVLTSANLPSSNLIQDPMSNQPHAVGMYKTTCVIPGNFLNDGRYAITFAISTQINKFDVFVKNLIAFNVYENAGKDNIYISDWTGVVRPKLAWQTEQVADVEAIR